MASKNETRMRLPELQSNGLRDEFAVAHRLRRSWHATCISRGVEITAGIKNEWVQVERKRKVRAARRGEFFGHVGRGVRRVFVFLFIATLCVIVLDQRAEIQTVALA